MHAGQADIRLSSVELHDHVSHVTSIGAVLESGCYCVVSRLGVVMSVTSVTCLWVMTPF